MEENRKTAEQEQQRQARRRDSRWKTLVMCLAVAVAVIIGLVVYMEVGPGFGASGTGSAAVQPFPYPVENNSESKNFMKTTKDKLVLLNGTLLEFVNPSNGKKMKSIVHFYSNPVFDVNGKYVLTYDQGRKKMRIDTVSDTLFENELAQNIITAAIGQNGTFAVATVPEQGNSDLTVYSKSLKELFTWNSMDGYIIEMDISPDGKHIAVATTASGDTGLQTTVRIFQVQSKKEVFNFSLSGVSAPVIQYVSGNDFFVMSSNSLSYISNNKTVETLLAPGEQTLQQYACSDNGVLSVLYTKFEHSNSSMLATYSKSGKQLFANEVGEPVKGLYNTRSATLLLYNDRAEAFTRAGKLQSKTSVSPYAQCAVQFGSKLYVLSVGEVACVPAEPVTQ